MSEEVAAPVKFNERYEVGAPFDTTLLFDRYLAHDKVSDAEVLLCALRLELAQRRGVVMHFRTRMQAAAALVHPGFVPTLDWGRDLAGVAQRRGPTVYAITERGNRPTLGVRLKDGPIRLPLATELLLGLTSAAGFAARSGLGPLGLSPHTVLVDGSAVRIDQPGFDQLVGRAALDLESAQWRAPERFDGGGDGRSDVYEIGLIGYLMATGVAPFTGNDVDAVFAAHEREVPVAPSQRNPAVPKALEAVLGKCLAKNPDDRFADVNELRAALVRFREAMARYGREAMARSGREAMARSGREAMVGPPAPTHDSAAPPVHSTPPPPDSAPAPDDPDATQVIPIGERPVARPSQPGRPRPAGSSSAPPPPPRAPAGPARSTGPGPSTSGSTGGAGDGRNDQSGATVRPRPARRPSELGPPPSRRPSIEQPAPPRSRSGKIAYAAIFPVLATILGVLVYLLLHSVGVVGASGPKIDVPTLTGLKVDEATTKLADLGLVAQIEREPNTNVPADAVFRQNPPPGAKARRDSQITLSVSEGSAVAAVPDVVGQTRDAAQGTLYAAGLAPDIVEVEAPDDAVALTVLSQDPTASSPVPANKRVKITVATRSGKAKIPDLSGQTAENATISLQQLGFRTSSDVEASPTVAPGKVTRTDPPSDTSMQKGSVVVIYLSAGPQAPVPNVVGSTAKDGRAALEAKGFKVQVTSQTVTDSSQKGFVVGQRPAATESLEPGGIVVIRVGVLGPPVTKRRPATVPRANGVTDATFQTVPNPEPVTTAAPAPEPGPVTVATQPAPDPAAPTPSVGQ